MSYDERHWKLDEDRTAYQKCKCCGETFRLYNEMTRFRNEDSTEDSYCLPCFYKLYAESKLNEFYSDKDDMALYVVKDILGIGIAYIIKIFDNVYVEEQLDPSALPEKERFIDVYTEEENRGRCTKTYKVNNRENFKAILKALLFVNTVWIHDRNELIKLDLRDDKNLERFLHSAYMISFRGPNKNKI